MPGERFSELCPRDEDLGRDSSRARHRIGALLGETVLTHKINGLAAHLGRQLGVAVPGEGGHVTQWQQFMRNCSPVDFLDSITVVYRFFFWHVSEGVAIWWRDAVRTVFAEEHLAYDVDDAGGVRPRIDPHFQSNAASTVLALQSERHRNVREHFESALKQVNSSRPNYKQAWRATLAAMESLFGLMFPYARLTDDQIEARLFPEIERAYAGDVTAQEAARSMVNSLKAWTDASNRYRHRPGDMEVPEPPAEVAVMAISQGGSFLRWLAGLDDRRARIT